MKKMIAILSLAMMLGMTAIPNLAYAMPSEENAAIETVAAYVEENAEEFSDERIPIETVYFSVDKDGEVTIISGETETYKLVECQTAHCGRGKPHFDFGNNISPIVRYRHLPQTLIGMTVDCCSLV